MSVEQITDRLPAFAPAEMIAQRYGLSVASVALDAREGKFLSVETDEGLLIHLASFIEYRCAFARKHGRRSYFCGG